MQDKVEAVARALCVLDGRDPEQRTRSPGGRVGFGRAKDDPLDGPPLWESYRAEAERFATVAEALAPFYKPENKRW